jgi:chromosome segregation ATPase
MKVDQHIEQLEGRLAAFDDQIKEMEGKIDDANSKLKEDLALDLNHIKKKRHHAEEQLAQLRLNKAESWADEEFRSGMFAVFDDIGRRLGGLFTRHK